MVSSQGWGFKSYCVSFGFDAWGRAPSSGFKLGVNVSHQVWILNLG